MLLGDVRFNCFSFAERPNPLNTRASRCLGVVRQWPFEMTQCDQAAACKTTQMNGAQETREAATMGLQFDGDRSTFGCAWSISS